MNVSKTCAWRACALLLMAGSPALGDEQALTLRRAVELASAGNPEIAGFRPARQALERQAEANVAPPPTTVELQLENFAGTGDASGVEALEATLQLSRVVELGGKQDARRRLGEVEIDRLGVEQRVRRADILAELARRFLHVLSDQEQLAATQRATSLAEQAREVVEGRIKAGATSPVFLSRAEIALSRAQIEEEHAQHELASSRVSLAVLWGDTEARFGNAVGALFELPDVEPLEAYTARLASNADVLRFASEARLLEARQRLAESQRRPSITLNAGVRRLEALNDQALVAGIAIPLGASARAEPQIRAIESQREQLQFSEQSRRLELRAALFALYQELLHARTEASVLQTQVRPQAQRMVEVTDQGYRAGRFSLLELADAQKQLLEIERDAIRAAADFHTQLIEIERLTGVAVHALARGD